jgi:hypothetical protein
MHSPQGSGGIQKHEQFLSAAHSFNPGRYYLGADPSKQKNAAQRQPLTAKVAKRGRQLNGVAVAKSLVVGGRKQAQDNLLPADVKIL